MEVVLRLSPTGFCCATFFASEVLRASTVHQEVLPDQHFRKVRPDLCRSRIRVSGCPGWSPQTMPSDCKRWHIMFSIFLVIFNLSFSQKFNSSAFWIVTRGSKKSSFNLLPWGPSPCQLLRCCDRLTCSGGQRISAAQMAESREHARSARAWSSQASGTDRVQSYVGGRAGNGLERKHLIYYSALLTDSSTQNFQSTIWYENCNTFFK